MSLIETLVATAIAAVIAMMAGLTIMDRQKDFMKAQSIAMVIDTQSELKRWMASDHTGGAQCTDVLKFSFGPLQYNASSNLQTDIQIAVPGSSETYQTGKVIHMGSAQFTIGKLYVADVQPVRTAGSGALQQKTTYTGTIWLEAQLENQGKMVRRAVSNITMTLLDSSSSLVNCNTALTDDSSTNCSGMSGFHLDPSATNCSSIYRASHGCPSGSALNGQSACAPQSYSCGPGAILTEVRPDLSDPSSSCVVYQ